jgi:methylated-DNA-[protein]-cysteine S-methyltransferase
MLFFDQFDSQVGVIGVLAGPAGVREVGWRLNPRGASIEPDEMVQRALGQLREYFAGQRREFALPLDLPPMEPVTEAVLRALSTVGYGTTITYGELAELSGTGVPARAIGEIMAANPVPILIPVSIASWRAMGWAATRAVSPVGSWRRSAGCWRRRCASSSAGLNMRPERVDGAADNFLTWRLQRRDRLLCRRRRPGPLGARLILARAGVRTTVLEKHADFLA